MTNSFVTDTFYISEFKNFNVTLFFLIKENYKIKFYILLNERRYRSKKAYLQEFLQ